MHVGHEPQQLVQLPPRDTIHQGAEDLLLRANLGEEGVRLDPPVDCRGPP